MYQLITIGVACNTPTFLFIKTTCNTILIVGALQVKMQYVIQYVIRITLYNSTLFNAIYQNSPLYKQIWEKVLFSFFIQKYKWPLINVVATFHHYHFSGAYHQIRKVAFDSDFRWFIKESIYQKCRSSTLLHCYCYTATTLRPHYYRGK